MKKKPILVALLALTSTTLVGGVAGCLAPEVPETNSYGAPTFSVANGNISIATDVDGADVEYKVGNAEEWTTGNTVALETTVGDYTVTARVVKANEGDTAEEGTFTYSVKATSIDASKTATNTLSVSYEGISLDAKNGTEDITLTEGTYTASASCTITLTVAGGWDNESNTYYVDGDTVTKDIALTVTGSTQCVIEDANVESGSELATNWTVQKYDESVGWTTTGATLTLADSYVADQGGAMQLNIWNNRTSFRYSKSYSADGTYNQLSFDMKGDGYANIYVQLANSTNGVYVSYDMGILENAWKSYTLAMNDSNWMVTYGSNKLSLSSALAMIGMVDESEVVPYFDTIRVISKGYNNDKQSILYIDNIAFANVETAQTSQNEIDIPAFNYVIDFNDGAGSGVYTSDNWTQTKYGNSGWEPASEKMNSRSKNGNKVVNFYAGDGMTYKYVYSTGKKIGTFDHVTIVMGNYYTANAANVKIALINAAGDAIHYLEGNASTFAAIESTKGVDNEMITKEYDVPMKDYYGIYIVTKNASTAQTYLYVDDITFTDDYVAPDPDPEATLPTSFLLDFNDGAGSGAYSNAKWTQYRYTDAWVEMANSQMNSRPNSVDKTNLINVVASKDGARKFIYNENGTAFCKANAVSFDVGNYFSTSANISIKFIVVDSNGVSHYVVGGSSEWGTIPQGMALSNLSYDLDSTMEIKSFTIVVQSSLTSAYLYIDNINFFTK